jgi:hypothetical protein
LDASMLAMGMVGWVGFMGLREMVRVEGEEEV